MKSGESEGRPPLVPVDTSGTYSSEVSELQDTSLFGFGENEFELMHVTITIHGLTGITSAPASGKRKRVKRLLKSGKHGSRHLAQQGSSTVSASCASSNTSSTGESVFVKQGTPTTAVVAFSRNVSNSQTKILTHLPSLPLGLPSSSIGHKNRFMASWPEAPSPFLRKGKQDHDENNRSSFTFLRVMMREPLVPCNPGDGTNKSAYVHETVELVINLSRGKEMIPLGKAKLSISGDEEGSVLMSIPVKPVAANGRQIETPKPGRFFKRSNPNQGAGFRSDPQTNFSLDENAALRLTVRTVPHQSIKSADARKKARESHAKKEIRKIDNQSAFLAAAAKLSVRTPSLRPKARDMASPGAEPQKTIFQGLFCGNACGAPYENELVWNETNQTSVYTSSFEQLDHFDTATGTSIASSALSSVSSSDSESDFESVSTHGDVHLNRKIVVRKPPKTK